MIGIYVYVYAYVYAYVYVEACAHVYICICKYMHIWKQCVYGYTDTKKEGVIDTTII